MPSRLLLCTAPAAVHTNAPHYPSALLVRLRFPCSTFTAARMAAYAASLAALSEAFPGFTKEQLAAALQRHQGNLDAAAAALLVEQVRT